MTTPQQLVQTLTASWSCAPHGWGDNATWVLLIAGMLGGIIRAVAGQHPTWTRRTFLDIGVGALLPPILAYLKWIPIEGASILMLVLLGLGVGISGSYLLAWVAYKVGIFKTDVRADAPGGSEPIFGQKPQGESHD